MQALKNILFAATPGTNDGPAFERAVAIARQSAAALTVAEVLEDLPPVGHLPAASLDELRTIVIEDSTARLEPMIALARARGVAAEGAVLFGTAYLELIREVLRGRRDLLLKVAEGPVALRDRLFGSTDMHLIRKCPCPVLLMQPSPPKAFSRVLAAVDFDQADETAHNESLNRQIMEFSSMIAARERAELHVLHVWEAVYESTFRYRAQASKELVDAYVEHQQALHRRGLDQLMQRASDWVGKDMLEAVKPEMHFLKGRPREVIPGFVRNLDVDLLVMGTVARTGIPGLIIGNTAESIFEQVPCSVLALKPEGFHTPVTLNGE